MFVSTVNPLKLTDNQYELMKERLTKVFNASKVKPAADNVLKEIIYSVFVENGTAVNGDDRTKMYSVTGGLSPKEFFFDERNKRYVIIFDEPSLVKNVR
jgi:hypothetical protein